jgi:23S rRNA pseudouridine2605 synthase
MRLNQFIALSTGMSRRAADKLIEAGQVTINDKQAALGTIVNTSDKVVLDGKLLNLPAAAVTIMLNKPVGYVCSRAGQGSKTVYDLLPKEFYNLKPVGRLDKDSSGLLLLTNDGQLANQLTHPSFAKEKVYEVELDKNLAALDRDSVEKGVILADGVSKLALNGAGKNWIVGLSEGRNRQVRRTFAALGYAVTKLHRTKFGPYKLDSLEVGNFRPL